MIYNYFSFRLSKLLRKRGITEPSFERATGVPFRKIKAFIKGKDFPSSKECVLMEKKLGISIYQLCRPFNPKNARAKCNLLRVPIENEVFYLREHLDQFPIKKKKEIECVLEYK